MSKKKIEKLYGIKENDINRSNRKQIEKTLHKMKKNKRFQSQQKIFFTMLLATVFIFVGCNQASKTEETLQSETESTVTEDISEDSTDSQNSEKEKTTDNSSNTNNTTNVESTSSTSVTPISYTQLNQIVTYDTDDNNTDWNKESAVYVTLNGDSITLDGKGASVDGSVLTITSAGTYVITGTLNDGQIIIDTDKNSTVRLVLNGASITCSNHAAIYSKQADKTIITLEKGTENSITDGVTYQLEDGEDEPSGAIFSKDDLTINGTGTLKVVANYKDGIVSKDDLKVMEGTIYITSADDGLLGRDLLAIHSGVIELTTTGDGMKSTNDEDETKGNIVIENGTITISAKGKGINAKANLLFIDGTYHIVSEDDSIHSNYDIIFFDGIYTLSTGDDGVHADNTLTIQDGTISVTKSCEGLESYHMEILGGDITVVSSDDGINVAGGNDSLAGDSIQRSNTMSTDANSELKISGGIIKVDASGDGIDSNGTVEMTGGEVYVSGPSNSGNGALDYDKSFNVSGGTLVAAGSVGMAQNPSSTSSQKYISMTFTSAQTAGTEVSLRDKNGNVLAAFIPEKQYQNVIFSTKEITSGETYSIYSDEKQIVEFAVSEAATYVNESGITTSNEGMMGGKGNRGDRGQKGKMRPDSGTSSDGTNQTPPEMPERMEGQTPPEIPEGAEGQTPPEIPEGMEGQMPSQISEGVENQT